MIRQLQQQSGAVIELNRDPTPNSDEKIFIVKGTYIDLYCLGNSFVSLYSLLYF